MLALVGIGLSLTVASNAAAEAPPTIESESVSSLSPTDATLGARINPEGSENNVLYQFQVALNASEFRSAFTCPTEEFPAGSSLCLLLESQPGALPIRVLAAGTGGEPVSLDLAQAGMELQPHTTYHYRVIAAEQVQTIDVIDWAEPIVYGADQTFKTSGNAPAINSESVSSLTPTDATLEAEVNPGALETSYAFHLLKRCEQRIWPCGLADQEISLPGGQLPASDKHQHVSLNLNSVGVTLAPGRDSYEFWVSATNSAGSIEAAPEAFTTPPLPWKERPAATESTSQQGPPFHRKHRRRCRHGVARACSRG